MLSLRATTLTCLAALTAFGCSSDAPDPRAQSAVVGAGVRRLSRAEYDNTLRDLLSNNTQSGFAMLPEDVNDPFDNDYTTQQVSPALIGAAETLATAAAARALTDPVVRAKIIPCQPQGPSDTACLQHFVTAFGRRALRRPLTDDEIAAYVALNSYSVEAGDFYTGVGLVIQALLQDVGFLYRVEAGTPVNGGDGTSGIFKLNDYEVATRLSYFLTGSTPDDALLDAAAAGQLENPSDIRTAAMALLARPQARDRVERFHSFWLGYHQLPHPADLTAALRAESAALIDRVVFDQKSDYFDLFRAKDTYLTPFLAMHYGLPAPTDPAGGWVDYGKSGRQGILSHGSVLSAGSKFADTSPTQRGLFIRTRLLCETFGQPPPNVDKDNPPPGAADACKADKYAAHGQGGCASCHARLDPVGFGLENYDKSGMFRTHEDGKPQCVITGNGALAENGVGTQFNGPAQLADLLLDTGALESCVVRQVYRFAIGRQDQEKDAPILDSLKVGFKAEGHAFDQLLLDVVSTDSFGYRQPEPVN